MGSVVLLTGATGKFGKQLTKDLVEEGQTVVLVSRSKEKISRLLNNLQISYSDDVFGFEVDFHSHTPRGSAGYWFEMH